MSNLIDEQLVEYLKKSLPECHISDHRVGFTSSTKVTVSLRGNNLHGFIFFIKIAEIDWSSGVATVTLYPNAGSDHLIRVLSHFNPKIDYQKQS